MDDARATCSALLAALRERADPANVAGMARYGISSEGTLGVTVAEARALVKEACAGRRREGAWRHEVAACLWDSGVHEARIMAAIVDEPSLVTREQAEAWALDVDSWDVCDQLCSNLLRRSPHAWELAHGWAAREELFVKRAAFVLAAQLAVHAKDAPSEEFVPLLALVRRESGDGRPMVRKGVEWALRAIGKRGGRLADEALALADELAASPERAARTTGRNAARELREKAAATRARRG